MVDILCGACGQINYIYNLKRENTTNLKKKRKAFTGIILISPIGHLQAVTPSVARPAETESHQNNSYRCMLSTKGVIQF